MSDKENVVYLAFSNEKLEPETLSFLACKNCRNKTYKFMYEADDAFPKAVCAGCGVVLGKIGWAE